MRGLARRALCLVLCASCVNVSYVREHANEPIPEAMTDGLLADHASLGDVIERLGAPTIVWPSLNGRVVMAYAWLDQSEWGLSVSYTFRTFVSASIEWDSEHAEIPAVVLEFDPQLQLRIIRRGLLRDLAPEPVATGSSALELVRTYR